jgi:hypothetical protein
MRRTILCSLSLALFSALLVAFGCDDSAVKNSSATERSAKPSVGAAIKADAEVPSLPTANTTALAGDTKTSNSTPPAQPTAAITATSNGANSPDAKPTSLAGKVLGGGSPIAGSKLTVYAASDGKPTQVAQGETDEGGEFKVMSDQAPAESVVYLVAKGGTVKSAAERGPTTLSR